MAARFVQCARPTVRAVPVSAAVISLAIHRLSATIRKFREIFRSSPMSVYHSIDASSLNFHFYGRLGLGYGTLGNSGFLRELSVR